MPALEYTVCKQEHLLLIRPQPNDRLLTLAYSSRSFKDTLKEGYALTAWHNHRPIGVAGLMPIQGDSALAWAMIGADAGPHLRAVTQKIANVLDNTQYTRVEMRVKHDFKEAHRWARILGFKVEAPLMRKSGVFGEDETLYARIK